jgi:hypothetical protein
LCKAWRVPFKPQGLNDPWMLAGRGLVQRPVCTEYGVPAEVLGSGTFGSQRHLQGCHSPTKEHPSLSAAGTEEYKRRLPYLSRYCTVGYRTKALRVPKGYLHAPHFCLFLTPKVVIPDPISGGVSTFPAYLGFRNQVARILPFPTASHALTLHLSCT